MKQTKLLTLISLVAVAATVCSCSGDSPSASNQYKFRDKAEANTNHQKLHDGEKVAYPCPSLGNSRVFVVPVQFTDYPASEIGTVYNSQVKNGKPVKHSPAASPRDPEEARKDIENVYFGDAEDTAWHSLRSYYQSSSYGKLNFEGLVAPWTDAFTDLATCNPVSAVDFAKGGQGAAKTLASNLISYYSDDQAKKYTVFKDSEGKQMFKSGKEFLQYFDSDKDGCFDLIEVVYSAPFYATNPATDETLDNDLFWAFCGSSTTVGTTDRPKMSKWAWQSYYTTVEGGTYDDGKWRAWTCEEITGGEAKVDAHTIVHETGHGLGLDDYYDYDYKQHPICDVDMMAYNVGDHSSYSKNLLGWSNPIVVTGPTTVTVNSFTNTGDCIMVPYRGYFDDMDSKGVSDKANTFHTEYISIELYNPTGVNTYDAAHKYIGSYPLCPNKVGLKFYHVDSRLGVYDYSSGSAKFAGYTDSIVSTSSSSIVTTANSNTGSATIKDGSKYHWLYEYVGRSSAKTYTRITDESLFQEGDTFNSDTNYKGYTFNSGKAFGYKITIDKLTEDSATLTFTKA